MLRSRRMALTSEKGWWSRKRWYDKGDGWGHWKFRLLNTLYLKLTYTNGMLGNPLQSLSFCSHQKEYGIRLLLDKEAKCIGSKFFPSDVFMSCRNQGLCGQHSIEEKDSLLDPVAESEVFSPLSRVIFSDVLVHIDDTSSIIRILFRNSECQTQGLKIKLAKEF